MGFSYADDDDWDLAFGYGYGGGVRLGESSWVYSWYPYGGHQRIAVSVGDDDYGEYWAPATSYGVVE